MLKNKELLMLGKTVETRLVRVIFKLVCRMGLNNGIRNA